MFAEQLEDRALPSAPVVYPTYVLADSPTSSPNPSGTGCFTPNQVRTAYGINSIANFGSNSPDGTGETIAIVDAYNDPDAISELDGFDESVYLTDSSSKTLYQQYGPASTFFSVYNQSGTNITSDLADSGSGGVPGVDSSGDWETEEALDIEWAHAIAPGATIILVEANNSSSLYTAEATAASLAGVTVVSNSWGGAEFDGETDYDSTFTTPNGHANITFLAGSGDAGWPGLYPAYSPNVVAVGGTSLTLTGSNTISTQVAWSTDYTSSGSQASSENPGSDYWDLTAGSGGGTSDYESEPPYQDGVQGTGSRTIPDVSFLADPGTGVAIYDSYNNGTTDPWEGIGGTSLACPCWAGIVSIIDQGRVAAGLSTLSSTNGTTSSNQAQTLLYKLSSSNFSEITEGSNYQETTGDGFSANSNGSYSEITGIGTPVANTLVPNMIAALSFTTTPSSAIAGSAFTVKVSDTADGSGISGAIITIASSSGSLIGTTTETTNASGVATFSLTLDTSGTYSLTATTSALSAASSSFIVSPASPTKLEFIAEPTGSITAGTNNLGAVTVELLDTYNNVANSSGTTTITLALNKNAFHTLGAGSTTGTIGNGSSEVTFNGLDITTAAASYSLTASGTGLTSIASSAFTIVAAGPAELGFSTEPGSSITAAVDNLSTVTAELFDNWGNVAKATSTTTVTLALNQSQFHTIGSGTATATISSGNSTVSIPTLDVTTANSGYTLTATSSGLLSATSSGFTIVAAAPAKLVFSVEPSGSIVAATANLGTVAVQLQDSFGNVAKATSNTTITLSLNQHKFYTANSTTTTGMIPNGSTFTTFAGLDVTTAAAGYSITATSGTLTSTVSSAFMITANAPAQLTFNTQPASSITAAVGDLSTVSVELLDTFGNVTTASTTTTVTLSLNQNQFHTLGSTTATANINSGFSFATFTNLDVTIADSGYSLVATSSGLASSTSNTFTVTPAAAALSFLVEPASSISAAVGDLDAVSVELVDPFDNVAKATSTTTVTLTLSQGNFHSLGGTTATTTINVGSSAMAFSDLDVTTVGTGYSLTATASGLTSATSSPFAITAAAPAALSFSTPPAGNITAAVGDLDGVTAELLDSFGNVATSSGGTSVTLTLNQGSYYSLGGTTTSASIANDSSTTSFSNLDVTAAGSGYKLTASAPGLTSAISSAFTIVAASPAQLAFATEPANSLGAGVGNLTTVSVELLDTFGNVATATTATTVTVALNQNQFYTLGTTTAVTTIMDDSSSATFSSLDVATLGSGYSLTATSGILASAISNTFAVVAGTPYQVEFSSEPASSFTAAVGDLDSVTVQLFDMFGNVTDATGTTTITLSLNQNTFHTLGGTTATATISSGSTFTFSSLDVTTVGTGYSLTATGTGLVSAASSVFAVTVATPAQLGFSVEPAANVTAGVGNLSTVAVEIQDAFGNADTEAGPTTVTLTLNQNQFHSLGTTTTTATIGAGDTFTTISNLDVTAAAAGYSLSASTTGLTSSLSSTFTVKAAAAAQLTFSAEPASSIVAANDNLSSVAVELLDSFGNVATATSTTSVTLTLNQGMFHTIGSGTATATITNGNSFGTVNNLDVTAVNTGYQIGATSTGLLAATSTSFAIAAAAPAKLSFSVEPAGSVTAALGNLDTVTVELLDTFGNVAMAAINTNVTLTLNQGSFHTLGGNTATATIFADSSTTTFSNLDVTSVAGGYSLTASNSGLAPATSTSFAVMAAAASQLAFLTQPASSVTAAVGDLDSVAVELLDPFGNVATSSGTTSVTLAINQGKFATLNSTTATATIGNDASSTTLGTLDVTAATAGYSLSATSSGLISSTSSTFAVIAAAPAQLSFSTEPAASITAAVGDLETVAVQLLDQFGNVAKSVGGTTVTIALNQGSFYTRGSGSATANIANGATSTTFSNLDVTTVAAGYSLTATASGLTSTISTAFAVQVSTASQLKFLTEPAGGTAAVGDLSTVAVELLDPFGNVATAGSPVTVSLTLNQGTFHTLGGTRVQATIASGSSSTTFGTLDVTTVGAGYSLSATATGMTSTISSAFAITAASPAKLGFSTQPASNVPASLGDLDSVTVELLDAFGNVATGNVIVSLSLNQGQFHTLGGTTTSATISGSSTTTFANLDVTAAGSGYQLTASATGLTGSSSNSFAVVGGAATQLVFSTEPASAMIAAVDDLSNVTVELLDAFGNVTKANSATTVTFGINQGQFHTLGGTSATATIAANASTVSISDLDVTATGSGYQLSASSSGLSGALSTTFTVTTVATTLAFSTEPAANLIAAIGDLGSIVVQLRDAFGNVATAVSNTNVTLTLNQGQFHTLGATTVSFSIPAGSSSANVPGLDVTTAASGYQLQATGTGLTAATSSTFTIAASTPTQLNFATSPASSIAAATDNLANVVMQLRDMFGNVATTTSSQNVTVTINQGLFHTLDSASALANFAAGASSATISDLDLTTIGSGYYLTAFASGLTTATSSTFSVTAGAPTQLSFIAEPASFLGAGIGNLSNVEVGLLDSFGNVATATTSTTVTLSLNAGSFHTLGGNTVSATIPAGSSATGFGELDETTLGSGYLLTATATGLPAVASNVFSVTSGAPVQIVFTSEPPSSIVAGIDNLSTVGVELLDVFGNVTPTSENLPLTLTLNKGSFHTVGNGTATETVASGASSMTFANLDVTTAGTGYQFTVSGPGLSSVTSSPFAITGRSATQVVFATQPANTTAGVDNLSGVTVQLLDPFGNYATAANSVTVVLSLNKGSFYSLGSQSVIGSIAAGSTTLNIPNLDVTAAGTGYTLTVTGSGMTGATSNAFNITAAAASQLAFATEPAGSIGAALGNLGSVSVELLDPFDNVATATNSSVPVSLAISSGTFHTLGSATASGTIAAGQSSTTFTNLDDTTAGSGLSLAATASGLAEAQSTSFTITPAAASVLTVTPVGTTTVAAGTPFSVQVSLQDTFGNIVTGYSGRIAFSSTDPKASLPAAYTFNAGDDGVHTFANAVTFKTVGSQALTATDTSQSSLSGTSSDVSVTLASALQLVVTAAPATAGTASNVTVTAEDLYGNVDTGFTGTISFQSSDTSAVLPSPYSFTTGTGGDNGVHTFSVTLNSPGNPSITVSDSADGLSRSATATVAASLAFTTSGFPAWTVNKTGYAQTLAATGGTSTLSYSISSGSLPAGLSLSSGGAISGTPTATGTFSVTIQVSDALGAAAQQTYSLTINPAPSLSPASLETWTAGFAGYSQSVAGSGGTGSLSYSISAGSLPAGLSLNAGTGAISGTPTASGVSTFTVKATDALGVSATQSFSITIDPAIVISTSTLSNWTVNTAGYSQTVQASKGTGTLAFGVASGSLPAGLTLNSSTGAITGTPNSTNSGAPYQFTISVSDSVGASAQKAYSVTINPALAISTTSLENWQANKSGYSQTIQTTGGTGAVRFSVSAGALPTGLSLNTSTGAITGTPAAGSYSFTIAATDAVGAVATEPFTVVIYAPVTIATTSLPAWTVNLTGYSQVVSASGGVPALSYAVTSGALPAGLSLDPNAGSISGTPTNAGTFSFTVTVTDSIGTSASQPFSITVNSPITVTTTTLANWTENQSGYNQTVRASGGTGTLSYSVSAGSLPTGLSLNAASGVISGTPTDANGGNPFTFTITATDSLGASGSQSFSVNIASAPTITTTALADWTINQGNYSQTLSAVGGTGAIHYTVSAGALPAGLALNATTGIISGTPTSINNGNPYVFSITATDADGASSLPQAFSVTIDRAVALTLPAVTAWTVNATGYSETFSATGGTGALTFSVASGALPAGLTLASNAGTLSGTPTAVGTFQFTVDATDSIGATAALATSVKINAAPTMNATTLKNWTQNQAGYSQVVSATGGTGTLTYSLASGNLPTGLSLSSAGVISGTPTNANGGTPFQFAVQATDTLGVSSVAESFSLTIAPAITFSTTNLAAWTVGRAGYSQTVSASGGTGALAYSIASGSLPSGLTLNSAAGTLSGTPSVATTSQFTVAATDSNGAVSKQAFSLTINPAPTITTSSLESWTAGQANYSQTLVASGGTGAISFSVTAGSLPGGLSLNSTTGVISGTPSTATGSPFSFTITAKDSTGATATKLLSITIHTALAITTASLANWTVNRASYSQVIATTGGTPAITYGVSAGSLPAGLSLSTTSGAITGMPTASGPFSFTITATDAAGASSARNYSITIAAAPLISTTSLPAWTLSKAYSQKINASGGTGALTFSVSSGALPAGLTLNSTSGIVSGTPSNTNSGRPYTFTITATDTTGASTSQAYSLTISAAVTITTASVASWTANQSGYSQALSTTGGTSSLAFSVSAGSLPSGLSLNAATGVISGTPSVTVTNATTYSFTITATDTVGATGTHTYSLVINPAVTLNTVSLVSWTQNEAGYKQTLSATGGTGTLSYSVPANTLPAGLSLSASGTISGTPTATGSFTFTVTATDATGATAQHNYTIVINPAIAISTAALPSWTADYAYNQKVTATGGTGALTYRVSSGSLPTGLSLNASTGAITGTPTNTNSNNPFQFTLSVSDATGATAQQSYSVVIHAALAITTTTLPGSTVHTAAYSQVIATSGGTGSVTYKITSGSVPPGLTLNTATGQLTGTPAAEGTYTFVVTVTDALGDSTQRTFSMTIS